jgi:3-oxoacyl-[acyl-carrier-protein] synthase III
MNILAMGTALPEGVITNNILLDLGVSLSALESKGITQRSTVLEYDYLKNTGNHTPKETLEHVTATPTDLGFSAASLALEQAGISIEQVGLIVGETSSQLQTIPGESQRIAGRFGLKIPCFDFSMSACSFVNYLRTISSWQSDRIADYTLCISVHTPTRFVDYSKGKERIYLSDGAYAMVLSSADLSTQKYQPCQVLSTYWCSKPEHADVLSLSLYGHINCEIEQFWKLFYTCLLERFAAEQADKNVTYIFPSIFKEQLKEISSNLGLQDDQIFWPPNENGFALGADAGLALSAYLQTVHTERAQSNLSSKDNSIKGSLLRIFTVDSGFTFAEATLRIS